MCAIKVKNTHRYHATTVDGKTHCGLTKETLPMLRVFKFAPVAALALLSLSFNAAPAAAGGCGYSDCYSAPAPVVTYQSSGCGCGGSSYYAPTTSYAPSNYYGSSYYGSGYYGYASVGRPIARYGYGVRAFGPRFGVRAYAGRRGFR
jgi:hypothetical protein